MEEVKKMSGSKFEPKLVDILINNIDEFAQFREQYPD